MVPLLVIDAWEHAWYLQYLNEKTKFFDAVWNLWNWNDVAERFASARSLDLGLAGVTDRANGGEARSSSKTSTRQPSQSPAGRA